MDNFLFPELTNRAPSRIRKLRAHKRRPKPLIPFFGPGGEGQADEVPLPTPTPPVMTPRGPILKNEPERIKAVNTDQRAVVRVAANPNATDSNPFFIDIDDGKDAVAKFGGIIEMEAKKQGVDPDLVKAIMFAENARGNRLGLDQAFQDLGFANTFLPMNINPSHEHQPKNMESARDQQKNCG